jgi:4-hydroxybenzoate polyprenyltransferase
VRRIGDWLGLVRFSHSVFALPFAILSLLFATGGRPSPRLLVLVVVAAVAARTAAMAFNRWADLAFDRQNPRTRQRELVTGRLRPGAALALTGVASAAFILSAALLNDLCLWLSPAVLAVLLGYSYTKRFTWACHLVLGLALALAPLGAWLAARGTFEGPLAVPLLLAGAVLTWVAGFDVIYACQDAAFDRGLGLRSIPARFGVAGALWISAALHLVTAGLLVGVGLAAGVGLWWWVGVAAAVSLLAYQHLIVRPSDLSRVDAAFFTANGVLSVVLAGLAAIDMWLSP